MGITGWIGTKDGRLVTGWIADSDALDTSLVVTLHAGGWISDPFRANEFRNHLKQKKFGTAQYGFSISVPDSIDLSLGAVIDLHVGVDAGAQTKSRYSTVVTESFLDDVHATLRIVADGAHTVRKSLDSLSDLIPFAKHVLKGPKLGNLLKDGGRALTKSGDSEGAIRLLGAARALNPNDKEILFQYGVVAGRLERFSESLDCFRALRSENWRSAKVLSEHAQTIRRAIERGAHNPDPALVEELRETVERRLALDEVREGIMPPSIASTLGRLAMPALALRVLDHTMMARPDRTDVHVVRARVLIETGRVEEGLAIAAKVLEDAPDDEGAAQIVRTFRDLRGARAKDGLIARLQVVGGEMILSGGDGTELARATGAVDLQGAMERASIDWVAWSTDHRLPPWRQLTHRVAGAGAAGCLRLSSGVALWKATALSDVLEAGLASSETLDADLSEIERFYLRPAKACPPGSAVLISRWGGVKYGGGEHFLHSAACNYRDLGFDPIILGPVERRMADRPGPWAEDGIRYDFVEIDAISLRRLVVRENATLVHVLPGLGFPMATALGDMNVPFVFGVHYFREVLGGVGGDVFFEPDGSPIPRADFGYLLSRASAVYANSRYTQDLLERVHGVRCPIIFSVPEDQEARA